MRFFLLALALSVLGCDAGEPIAATSSPVGCWRSSDGELDLMPDGNWRQTFNVSPTTDSGTWTYDAGSRKLSLSIANASSANGPGLALWQVIDLTPAEMWTSSGSVIQWQAIACLK